MTGPREVALRLIGEPADVDQVLSDMSKGWPLTVTGTAAPGARRPSRRSETPTAVLQSAAITIPVGGLPVDRRMATHRTALAECSISAWTRTATPGVGASVLYLGPLPWPSVPPHGSTWQCCDHIDNAEGALNVRYVGPGHYVQVEITVRNLVSWDACLHLIDRHGFVDGGT